MAAALGVCRERTYEGQPALELEMAAAPEESGFYPASLQEEEDRLVLDTPAVFRGVLEDYWRGVDPAVVAPRAFTSPSSAWWRQPVNDSGSAPASIWRPCPGEFFRTP